MGKIVDGNPIVGTFADALSGEASGEPITYIDAIDRQRDSLMALAKAGNIDKFTEILEVSFAEGGLCATQSAKGKLVFDGTDSSAGGLYLLLRDMEEAGEPFMVVVCELIERDSNTVAPSGSGHQVSNSSLDNEKYS